MSTRLETYLGRASSGVSKAQRAVIQAELRGNIELRSAELELLGLTHAQGVECALEELGAPNHISHGMAWVYTAPRAVRWAFTAMFAAWCCIAPLSLMTVHVNASIVTDASGKLTNVTLETDSFSTALAAAGIGLSETALSDTALGTNHRFTTAHALDWATRDDQTRPSFAPPKFGLTTNLELLQALRVLCNATAHVTLESPDSSVVYRVTWQGTTSRIALNLDQSQALAFHESIGRTFKYPCQR